MTILLRLMVLMLASVSGVVLASSADELAVVKIVSRVGNATAKGSGWFVKSNGGFYVVTSEHVVAPVGVASKTEIRWDGKSANADLVFSDWSRGLAVLRVANPPANVTATDLGQLDANSGRGLQVGQRIRVAGFPFAQEKEALVSSGEISLLKSQRSFIAFSTGIEVTQTYGEFGMSGGPAFVDGASDAGAFVGILSHQVLKVVADQPSVLAPLGPTETARHLFLIPRETVFAVVREALAGQRRGTLARQSTWSAPLEIQAGNLIFREAKVAAPPSGRIGGDGGQIGGRAGGDGGQIGGRAGGDGGQIGGEAGSDVNRLRVQVSFNPLSKDQAWPFASSEAAAKSWQKLLLERKTVIITAMVRRDEQTGQLRALAVRSFEDFFRSLASGEVMPVIDVPENRRGQSDLERKIESSRNAVRVSLAQAFAGNEAGDALALQIRNLLAMSGEENRARLGSETFDRLLDPRGAYRTSWQNLYARDFDSSVDLMQKLNDLAGLLK